MKREICNNCSLFRTKRGGIISGDKVWCEDRFYDMREHFGKDPDYDNGNVYKPKGCRKKMDKED